MVSMAEALPRVAMQLIASLLLAAGAALAVVAKRPLASVARINELAPEFVGVPLSATGRMTSLSQYTGNVVVLNVWASWCAPCREEMPSLQLLHEEFRKRGLRVVAVSVDEIAGAHEIEVFVRRYGITFDVFHDAEAVTRKRYGVGAIPQTFVIDRRGVLRERVFGAIDWHSEERREQFDRLIGRD